MSVEWKTSERRWKKINKKKPTTKTQYTDHGRDAGCNVYTHAVVRSVFVWAARRAETSVRHLTPV